MHQFRKMVPIGILARRLSIIDLYIIQQKVFCSLLTILPKSQESAFISK